MIQNYLDEIKRQPSAPALWLEHARAQSLSRLAKTGFPTQRHEDWKDTNLSSITEKYFPKSEKSTKAPKIAEDFWKAFPHVVFYNGSPISFQISEPGVEVTRFSDVVKQLDTQDRKVFEQKPRNPNPFFDLNTSLVEEGVSIRIKKKSVVEKPIYLIYISDTTDKAHYYRNLISVESEGHAKVVEIHISNGGQSNAMSIPVTQIEVAPQGKLIHVKFQNEGSKSNHIGVTTADILENGSLETFSFSFGGSLVRNDIELRLVGEGAHCTTDGLYVGRDHQIVDHHTLVDHTKPHCTSTETYKGILTGSAHGIFQGKIIVAQDAQKTDAHQLNQNLLLSPDARVNSAPQLEILADDVKCSHGATIGRLDMDQIFYLRSRGIDLPTAKEMLIQAYAQEIISKISIPELSGHIEQALLKKLELI